MELSLNDLQVYDKNFKEKSKYKILQGVLRKANISQISINQNSLVKLPFKFNHELPEIVTATDQMYTGRCWIFAGLNIIRHKMINHYKLSPDFELSQSYIFRCDKLERCNTIIELIYTLAKEGKTNESLEYVTLLSGLLGDGGSWDMFVNIVEKYGCIPKDIYPESAQSSNSSRLNDMLKLTLLKTSNVIHANMDIREFRKYKKNILDECYRIINLCFGNIPDEFAWTFKDKTKEKVYSAHKFYNSTIKPIIDLTEFVSISNFPVEKYNQLLAVEYLHNIIHEDDTNLKRKITNLYLNVDIKTFKEAIFKSITHKTGIWFACDVSQFWINRGTILDQNSSNLKEMFDVEFTLNKKASLETRTNVPNHAMVIVGCQKNDDGFKRWKVENSHGTESILKGFITMSDSWFDEYVICAAVHINSLPIKMRALVKSQKDIKWLPFYSPLGVFAD